MNLLLLSDSHGNSARLMQIKRLLAAEPVDAILFAGDGHGDMSRLNAPCEIYEARGNCDVFSRQPDEQVVELQGVRIFLTHGHLYSVKRVLGRLASQAKASQAGYAVYGHSHRQEVNLINGVRCINPGALQSGQYAKLSLPEGRLQFF